MRKHYLIGIIASLSLILLYFLIMIILNPIGMVLLQFREIWFWIVILSIGFGFQVGLFIFIREYKKVNPGTVAASGTISTGSMIACCAHHISDILPILGLSAIAIFLDKYQISFMLLGIFSNLVGILMMFRIIKNSGIKIKNKIIKTIISYNLNFLINVAILIGIISILISIGISIRGGF